VKRIVILALLLGSAIAHARGANAKFLIDFAPGVTFPIGPTGPGGWPEAGDPSFKHSIRIGAELWFNRRFAFAGEGDFDVSPQMFDDGRVFARVRGMIGFRLVFGFGVGAFFLRHCIGADYLVRRVSPPNGDISLALEPGFGLQFRFARYGVAGFAIDFPTAIRFGPADFTMDVQFLGFIGVRI
jgi:hypothetical protein